MVHTVESRRRELEKVLARRVAWIEDNGPCRVCGSTENLEVDHIDPAIKISHSVWSWREDKRLPELAKCQVLCQEHHKEKTNAEKRAKVRHGSETMYGLGCRCQPCKNNKNEMKRVRRQRRRELGLPVT